MNLESVLPSAKQPRSGAGIVDTIDGSAGAPYLLIARRLAKPDKITAIRRISRQIPSVLATACLDRDMANEPLLARVVNLGRPTLQANLLFEVERMLRDENRLIGFAFRLALK